MTNVGIVVINGINTLAGVHAANIFLPLGAKVFGVSIGNASYEVQMEQLKLSNYSNYHSYNIKGENVVRELLGLDAFITERLGVVVNGVDMFLDIIAAENFASKVDRTYISNIISDRMQYPYLFNNCNWIGKDTRIVNITSTLEETTYNKKFQSDMIGYIDGVVSNLTKSLQFNRIFVNSILVNSVCDVKQYSKNKLGTLVPSLVYHIMSCDHVTHRYISYKVETGGKVTMLNSLWDLDK